MGHISKTDTKRWFMIQNAISGEPGIVLFGICAIDNVLDTGQPNLNVFLIEDTLEVMVNITAGIADYYKDAVESGSQKFIGPSGKYPSPAL